MAEEIRGLNVKFDADFTEFKKNMKAADSDIKSTQKQLKTLQDSLKLKWDSQKFTKAQQEAQKALEASEKKASLLKERLAEVEKAGVTDKNRAEYNYLSEEIEKADLSTEKLKKSLQDLDELRLKNLTSGIDNVSEKLDKAAQKTKGLSTAAAALGAGLIATGLNAVSEADNIATLATQYELSTTALQRFNYVALQTDTEAETLYKAFTKVRAGVADLSTGVTSTATTALEQLGISFKQFDGTEEQFYAIIDSLSNMEDQTKMLSLANDIFGERFATNLLPLIYAGTDAINEYKKEFESTGALTEQQVAELAEYDNALNQLKTQYANITLQLGSELFPVMQEFSTFLTEDILPIVKNLVEWFGNLDENQKNTLITLIALTAALSPTLKVLSNMGKGISSLITWIHKLDVATIGAYGKWMLLAAAVGSLLAVIANWSEMNTVQRVVGLLGALSAAALAAAVAFGVFHSAWSVGLAIAGIVAGIATATAAIAAAGKEIGSEVSFDANTYASSVSMPDYDIPTYPTSSGNSVTNNDNSYIDNSNIVINIEQNEYMSEDDIIKAVNKGLKLAKQSRS